MVREYINNIIYSIRKKLLKMTKIQKLVVSVIALFVIMIISKVIPNFFKDSELGYNYQEDDIFTYNLLQSSINDNNLFVTLKSIVDDFLGKTNNFYNGKNITVDDIYKECLTQEYRKNISKNEFKVIYNQIIEKVDKIKLVEGEFIPESITVDSNGDYILKYSNKIDENEIDVYIGLKINDTTKKYYVWYLE